MAAHPIVVVDDDLLKQLPDEFKSDPRYQPGARMELVPVASRQMILSPEETLAKWDSLRGLLAHSDFDPNSELDKEKLRELEEEAKWLRE